MAQGWLLVTLVGRSQAIVYLGLLGAVQFMPVLLLGLFGGIIVDVWPKRRTVIATQLAAGLLALILGGLVFFNVVQVWHVFVLALLLGLVNTVDMPARQSFVVEMVGGDDIANGIALNSAVFNGARIVGPAVGGVLIALVGTALCFILNGLSYGAVVIGLLAMHEHELMPAARLAIPKLRRRGPGRPGRGPAVRLAHAGGSGRDHGDRVRLHFRHELQRGPSGHGGGSSECRADRVRHPLRVDGRRRSDGRHRGGDAHRPRLRVLVAGGIVLGGAELVLAATNSFPVASIGGLLRRSRRDRDGHQRQLARPGDGPGPLRGRVMSVYTTVFTGSTPIGNGLTGGIGGLWGTPAALVMNGAVTIAAEAVAAVAVLRGAVRAGDRAGGGDFPKSARPGRHRSRRHRSRRCGMSRLLRFPRTATSRPARARSRSGRPPPRARSRSWYRG